MKVHWEDKTILFCGQMLNPNVQSSPDRGSTYFTQNKPKPGVGILTKNRCTEPKESGPKSNGTEPKSVVPISVIKYIEPKFIL